MTWWHVLRTGTLALVMLFGRVWGNQNIWQQHRVVVAGGWLHYVMEDSHEKLEEEGTWWNGRTRLTRTV